MKWAKLKSKRYCKHIMDLFGIDDLDSLKECIKGCKQERDMRYNGSYDAVPSILNFIKVDDTGIWN